MGRQPLSYEDHIQVAHALLRARNAGRDEVEYLNEYGLLATREWEARVRADAIRDVIEALEHVPAGALVGQRFHNGSWTAGDVIDGFLGRLAEIEAAARKGKWPR